MKDESAEHNPCLLEDGKPIRLKEEAAEVKPPWMREAANEIFNECILPDVRAFQSEIAKIIAKHAPVASPLEPEQVQSRSFLRRVAAMKGEPAPTFVATNAPDGPRERFHEPSVEDFEDWSRLRGYIRNFDKEDCYPPVYEYPDTQYAWEILVAATDAINAGSASASLPVPQYSSPVCPKCTIPMIPKGVATWTCLPCKSDADAPDGLRERFEKLLELRGVTKSMSVSDRRLAFDFYRLGSASASPPEKPATEEN
jgi:hypothetical protein